jgi:methylated-DNA-[protein]-cysteine S-methyltransferase
MRQSPRKPSPPIAGSARLPAFWGEVAVRWTATGLCRLDWDASLADDPGDALPPAWGAPLRDCLAGDVAAARDLPVDLRACSPFVQGVLGVLRAVPPRAVWTYGQLAGACGCRSSQAIGQAVGANPLPWVIPCHRILAAGGHGRSVAAQLGGFSGGLRRKAQFLRIEHPQHGSLPAAVESAVVALLS